MNAIRVLRTFFGAYSLISAAALGISPPQPSPAMNRQMPNSVGLLAKPLITVATLNSAKQNTMPFLRPKRSARVPKISAPNIMPNNA